MKQFRAYRRYDNDPKWYEITLGPIDNIKFYGDGKVWVHSGGDSLEATLLRDIKDLDNIPPEVQCVVCEMVTNDLCEGDIILFTSTFDPGIGDKRQICTDTFLGVICWDDDELEWAVLSIWRDKEEMEWPQLDEKEPLAHIISSDPDYEKPGHILTHRIEDGKVRLRGNDE